VGGFWDPLVALLDQMTGAGLLTPAGRDLIQRTHSAEEALGVLAAAKPARPQKWITAEER
jgi:predicted Rossmann-fold nucleotide-binding protein